MFRPWRTLVSVAFVGTVVWCSFHVRLGALTFAEHIDRIGRTPEAEALLEGTRSTLRPAIEEATHRLLGEVIEAPTSSPAPQKAGKPTRGDRAGISQTKPPPRASPPTVSTTDPGSGPTVVSSAAGARKPTPVPSAAGAPKPTPVPPVDGTPKGTPAPPVAGGPKGTPKSTVANTPKPTPVSPVSGAQPTTLPVPWTESSPTPTPKNVTRG